MADSKASKNATVKAQQRRYDTGSKENKVGNQKTESVIEIGLGVTHTGSINTGGNTNHGTDQETGDIEIGEAQQRGYNTGSNVKKAGKPKTGSVTIRNPADGSGDGLPVNHTASINTEGNINHGADQKIGDIEIGNVG